MRKFIFSFALLTVILSGCSSDEPGLQPDSTANRNLLLNKWVYAEMNRQYLWRDDMPDSLDCNYSLLPNEFFKSLLSKQDRFSYFTVNPSYSYDKNENYGFAFQEVADGSGRRLKQVLYITSPHAKAAGIKRGDLISDIKLSGKRVRAQKILASKKYPFQDDSEQVEYEVAESMGKTNSVLLDSIYYIDSHKIGYICYLQYKDTGDLEAPLRKFSEGGITDLILDLRYNPGGYVSTSQYLCNCIVDESGYGNIFQRMAYNDILTSEYQNNGNESRFVSYFSFPNEREEQYGAAQIVGLNMQRLYIITSGYTASASEATILCLRPYMDVITVGETTVGKGVGSWMISNPKFSSAIQPITMRYFNANNDTVPDEGLRPTFLLEGDIQVPHKDIGDLEEPFLARTISLIVPGFDKLDDIHPNENILPCCLTPVGLPSFLTDFYYNNNEVFNFKYE